MSLTGITIYAILVILIAGLLGGSINCLQARKADEPLPKSWLYYFLLSVAAAYTVPLFLSLTKSSVMTDVLSATTPPKLESWFILFAVCLLAAIYAQKFLESISNQLMKRMENVEQQSEQTAQQVHAASGDSTQALNVAEATSEQVANQAAEPAMAMQFTTFLKAAAPAITSADPDEQKVLNALKSEKYPLGRRSLGGIALESKLNRAAVTAILAKLVAAGTVEKVPGEVTGTDYYSLRAPG